MGAFFEQLLNLLTTPPGNLVYHAVLAFSIFGALQSSINHWRSSSFPQGSRMVIGLALLLLGQFALFAFAGLAWQDLASASRFIPPLDRAVTLLSIVILAWLWAFPESGRLADAAALLVSLLIAALALFGILWWFNQSAAGQGAGLYYNQSTADWLGESLALILLLAGVVILLVRRPNGWGLGLAMLVGLFAGHLAHWLAPLETSDFAGAVRLAELAVYPLLLALPQRFPPPAEAGQPAQTSKAPEQRRYSSDPKVMQAFLALATETSPHKFYQDVTRTLSQLMLADLCMLILPPDEGGHLTVPVGYNLIMDRSVSGFALNVRQAPVLTNALRRNRSLRLPSSSTSPDLLSLAGPLNLSRTGHLLAVPIAPSGKSPIMGVLLLSPYSNRGWTAEDQEYLGSLAVSLASILQRMQQFTQQQTDLEQVRANLETVQAEAERARQDLQALQALQTESQHERGESHDMAALVEEMQHQLQQEHARAEGLAALVSAQEGLQQSVAHLEARNREPGAMPVTPSPEMKNLEEQLHLALEDVAILKFALQEADERLLRAQAEGHPIPALASTDLDRASQEAQVSGSSEDLELLRASLQAANERLRLVEARGQQTVSSQQAGTVVTIAQELRQPVSSIVGYTDLLLSESVGILGATQRKFIERVKASTERVAGLLDEMIQAAALESDARRLNPVAVDLNGVIDEAVKSTLGALSEKNISLRVDLPEELPPIHADKDALQQVLANLLLNASGATPVNGEVSLRARLETKENEPGYMLVQVADAGGGIAPEAQPRIFSRLYRASNPTIPGLGDNGAGLSMVKTLVEAHGGRIWVDSADGRGATFSVLLPMADGSLDELPEGALAG